MSDVTQEESEFCCDGMRKALETYHAPLERIAAIIEAAREEEPHA